MMTRFRLTHLWSFVLTLLLITSTVIVLSEESANLDKTADNTVKGGAISFQAEVSKVLDILVNSLYTNRDIFLRELISNGSDALDKIRVLYLTARKDPVNKNGESPTMDISISFNTDAEELIIRDGGVGMTKDELSEHLGSLGTSGTKRFLEKLAEAQGSGKNSPLTDSNLIGQFGVGFYSVFLVADKVRVASKSDDDAVQYVWESAGDGHYYLYEDPRGNTLGRGTEITITLKPDAKQYLEVDTIKRVVHQYSEFVHFPIYVDEEVPVFDKDENKTTTATDANTSSGNDDDTDLDNDSEAEEDKEDEEENEKEPEIRYEVRRTLINANKPIWTRSANELVDDDYNKFYQSFTHDHQDPLYYSHFHVEGEIELDSILFIPRALDDMPFATDENPIHNVKLYVRRVFITDEIKELLPHYLSFVKGIVDSNDLPLNVSREVLQESRILRVIKKKLVRKALNMFADIAAQDERLALWANMTEEERAKAEESEVKRNGTKFLTTPTYSTFWELFGKHLRRGMLEDNANRGRLTKLLRYKSSHNETAYTSFQEYIDRMPASQKAIYYLSGDSIELIKKSPVLEDALVRNVEVLYMTDAIDEYVLTRLPEVNGKRLVNLAKEDAVFDDEDEDAHDDNTIGEGNHTDKQNNEKASELVNDSENGETDDSEAANDSDSANKSTSAKTGVKLTVSEKKAIEKHRAAHYAPLLKRLHELFGKKEVHKVILTKRHTKEAFLLSSSQYQISARLARIIRGQAISFDKLPAKAERVLEVNYRHPLVEELYNRFNENKDDAIAIDMSWVLYDTANMRGEFPVSDIALYARRVDRLLRSSVNMTMGETLLPKNDEVYLQLIQEEEKEAKARKDNDNEDKKNDNESNLTDDDIIPVENFDNNTYVEEYFEEDFDDIKMKGDINNENVTDNDNEDL